MDPIHSCIDPSFLQKEGNEKLKEAHLRFNWANYVGPFMGDHSHFERRKGTEAIVIGANPMVLQEIRMRSPQIIEVINKKYGPRFITSIKTFSGQHVNAKEKALLELALTEKDLKKESPWVPLEKIVLPKKDVQHIDNMLATMKEGPLKEGLREASISRKKKEYYLEKEGYKRCPLCNQYVGKVEEVCFQCMHKIHRRKISELKKEIWHNPSASLEELRQIVPCTSEDLVIARRECIQFYMDRLYQEDVTLEDRYQFVMLRYQKKRSQLDDAFVLEKTKYFKYPSQEGSKKE